MNPIYEKYRDDDNKLQYEHNEKTRDVSIVSHFHESVECVYLERGEMGVTVNGESFTVHAGEAIFINTFDIHSYASKKGNVTRLFIMGKGLTEGFFRSTEGYFPNKLDNVQANAEIFSLVQELIKYSGNNAADSAISCMLISLIAHYYPLLPPKNLKKEANIVRDIMTYIDKHFADQLTLEGLSEHFGYSPNHFSRLFNTYLGTHLRDYLNSVRVYNVRELLTKQNITVTDALYKCGFDSHSTFYRAYNRVYGEPPKK